MITLAGSAGSARRKLSGQFIDIGLAPDGATLVALDARDRVLLELFADKTTPARTIKANALQGSGPPSTGLTGATFSEGVEFRETPAAPGTPRVAFSSTLDLTMKNGFGSLETARFGGGVRFEQGRMTATARDARYGIAAGTLNLSGVDERTGRAPQVVDERATIEARRIDVALDVEEDHGRRHGEDGIARTRGRAPTREAEAGGRCRAGPPVRPDSRRTRRPTPPPTP